MQNSRIFRLIILDWWQWCSTENVSRMYRYFNVPFSKERTVDCFAATRWELNFCALLVSKPKGNSDISKVFVYDAVCRWDEQSRTERGKTSWDDNAFTPAPSSVEFPGWAEGSARRSLLVTGQLHAHLSCVLFHIATVHFNKIFYFSYTIFFVVLSTRVKKVTSCHPLMYLQNIIFVTITSESNYLKTFVV